MKDDKHRLRDIGEARLVFEDAVDSMATAVSAPAPNPLWHALPWALAAAAIVLVAWMLSHRTGTDTTSTEVMHFDIDYPPNVEPVLGLQSGFAVAPDGRAVSMLGVRDGVRRLYIRRFDRPHADEINDTTSVGTLF